VVHDGDIVAIDGVKFHIRDYGPCESHSDAVWFIDGQDAPIVFCGDLIYNNMHLFMKDGHALEWLHGLDRLRREFSLEARFYPAHGPSCGREVIYWTEGYIRMYLDMLKALLEGGSVLSSSRQQRLVAAMRSFLPKDDLIELAQFKLDETIAVLSQVVNATDIQESEVT
jgi:glyoxylase-like metal-dependent hydrolase (beta-lactamase superfamily II)